MNIRTRAILHYIETQRSIFKIPLGDERFNDGILQGLALVEEYIKIYEESEEKK